MDRENELTRTRKHREEWEKRVERLKELGLPQSIIDYEIEISKMSYREFENYKADIEKQEKQERADWIKQNPMRKEVVDNIFEFINSYPTINGLQDMVCGCGTCLGMRMDPLGPHIGMTEEEFRYDLYTTLIVGIAKEKLNTMGAAYE